MKQTKVDSVQNFLTPSKLLTSKMRHPNKPKAQSITTQSLKSPNNGDTLKTWGSPGSPRKERQSYKKNNNKILDEEYSHRENIKNDDKFIRNSDMRIVQDEKKINQQSSPNNLSLNNVIKDVPNESVNFSDSRVSKNSGEGSNARYKPVGNFARSQAFFRPKEVQQKLKNPSIIKNDEPKRSYMVNLKKNPQISQLQIKDLMHKLIGVRNQLQDEISELKHLLDNTSSYLENIDNEYEKIKEKIMVFTSRALDASFNEYKKNLPDWSKYQNVESAGINKLTEINLMLQSYERERGGQDFSNSYEIQKKIQNYKYFVEEVKNARGECLSRRPGVQEEKLRKFQNAVWQLGKF